MTKLTRIDSMDLMRGMQTTARMPNIVGNSKFTFAMAKNRRKLKPIIEDIQDTAKIHLTDYGKEMEDLALRFATVDPKTQKVIRNPNGQTTLDPIFLEDFNKGKEELNEKYKEDIKKNDEYMAKEVEVDIHLIDDINFPDMADGIADLLFPIRKE